MVQPIKPGETQTALQADSYVLKYINTTLSRPWKSYEMNYGRAVYTRDMEYNDPESIVQIYTEAGWNVEYISDYRDGDFFRFKRPS
jgi:hypothetical protein